jgi:hypothetical protein
MPCSSALSIFERAVVSSQCGATVGKTHLLDYPTHEVPLPLFGLGYDRACTFRGAPLPLLGGKHELQSSHFVRRLHPKFGFGYDWGRRFCELRGCFHWWIVVLLAVSLHCHSTRLLHASMCRRTNTDFICSTIIVSFPTRFNGFQKHTFSAPIRYNDSVRVGHHIAHFRLKLMCHAHYITRLQDSRRLESSLLSACLNS